MRANDRIHAAARHGIVSRPALLAAGVTAGEIDCRLANGSLRRIHAGVYATFGTPLSTEAKLRAALLAAGPEAAVSHRAALWFWGLIEVDPPLEITAPRWSHPVPDGVVIPPPNVLRPVDVIERQHLLVTNPLRSLLDAGAVLPPAVVGLCVERALTDELVTVKGLRVILADLGGRGRSGTAALRRHLDRRALGDKRPESAIEPLMARLLYRDLGIGPITFQPTLVLDGTTVRPDFLAELPKLVIEVDGLDAHRTREALDRDLARQNLLIRHGYLPLRYTITHLRRPSAVAAEIVAIARARIAELAAVAA
ncbi:MAG: DUF559 domain-containing protein [Actinomycetota bacterium]